MSIRLAVFLFLACLTTVTGCFFWLVHAHTSSIDAFGKDIEQSTAALYAMQQRRSSQWFSTQQIQLQDSEQQAVLLQTLKFTLEQTDTTLASQTRLLAQTNLNLTKELALLSSKNVNSMPALDTAYHRLREAEFDFLYQLEKQKQAYLHSTGTLFLAAVFLLIAGLVFFLIFFFFKPLKQFQHFIKSKNIEGSIEFRLNSFCSTEITDLVKSTNRLFINSNKQLKSSRLLSNLNEKLRSADTLDAYTMQCIEYLVNNMKLPGIAVIKGAIHDFKIIASCGKTPFIDPQNPLIKQTLEQESLQTYSPDKHTMTITMGEESIFLKVIYGVPLKIERGTLGLMYVPSARVLELYELQIISEVAKDISLAIERAENAANRQKTEQALSHQLELTHSIINAIPNPTFYRNAQGQFIGVNRAFLSFFDQFEMDIVGNALEQVYPLHIAEYIKSKEQEILNSGREINYPLTLEDGQKRMRDISAFEGPFYDEAGNIQGIAGLFIDVTEHNLMQQELISAKDEADRLTKVKSEFLANMSHEIRTPMNAILGMAHLALKTGLNEQQFNYVNKINNAAKQLLALINDILDFSKIEAGKLTLEHTAFELSKVLDNVATIIEIKANEKKLAFGVDWDEDTPNFLIGDPLRLGQVLINLAGNAVKFTEKGLVNIQVGLLKKEGTTATVRFSVRDTGIGMSIEQQKSLFQSFSQADSSISRKYGGTGLGLTISQQLVKLMGGEIYLESKPQEGSEFYFVIDLECANSMPIESLRPKFKEAICALVLDDNLHALTITHELLSSMGVQVLSTTDRQEAEQLLQKMTIDIAFIDWKLGTYDGLEFIKLQKPLHKKTKFVLITAYGRDFNISAQDKSLLDCIVLKPATPSYLYDAVISCMGNALSIPKPIVTNEDKSNLFRGLRILVAEDQPINQEIAVEILTHYGAEVDVANNGQEAIDKVFSAHFDVVLMDMQMPIVDGIAATHEIRRHGSYQTLPILAMTANAMQDDIQRCKQAGMNAHVAKPIDLAQLESSILDAVKRNKVEQKVPEISANEPPTLTKPIVSEICLDGIDIAEGIDRAAGNRKIYFQILEKFLTQQCEELINLQQALSIGDNELSAHLLHAIKGASANLSMHYLVEQCQRLEQDVKSGSSQATDIDYLVAYIKTQREKLSQLQLADIPKTEETDIDVASLLKRLEKALTDYDTDAITLAEKLVNAKNNQKENINNIPSESLQLLLTHVTRFEFSAAQDLLKHLRHTLH